MTDTDNLIAEVLHLARRLAAAEEKLARVAGMVSPESPIGQIVRATIAREDRT